MSRFPREIPPMSEAVKGILNTRIRYDECVPKLNAAHKASEAPVACGACMEWDPSCEDCLRSSPPEEPAPAPEPDPLKGIDAQKWAKEFMRIWSGRWSEVDEGLMISWFSNAIMRGFDEANRRMTEQPERKEPKPEPVCWKCGCRKDVHWYKGSHAGCSAYAHDRRKPGNDRRKSNTSMYSRSVGTLEVGASYRYTGSGWDQRGTMKDRRRG